MMNFHGLRQGRLVRLAHEGATLPAPSDVLWIDLLDPTPRGGEGRRGAARASGADPAGDGRDRGIGPPVRGARRPRHDGRDHQRRGRGPARPHPGHLRPDPDPPGLGALRRPGALPHVHGQVPAPAGGPHHQRQPAGLAPGEHRRARRRRAGDGGGRPERGLDPALHRGPRSEAAQGQAGRGRTPGADQAARAQEHDDRDPAREPAVAVTADPLPAPRRRGVADQRQPGAA